MMRRTNRPGPARRRFANLVSNPRVEAGDGAPDAWFFTLTGTEWAMHGHSGSRSLRVQVFGATADWRSSLYAAAEQRPYRVGLWVKGMGAPETVLASRWFADGNGETYLTEQWLVLNGDYADWTQVYHHVAAPAGARSGDLMLRAAFPTTADLYADDFTVRRLS